MQIQEIPVSEIIPYEHNPRKNDEAVPAVVESIKRFGFKVPVVLDKDGVIVAGHTRVKAAKELGMETVPCVIADDLTDEQVRAFRLADNKVSELAGWDFNELNKELEAISEDMSVFGFTESFDISALDDLFAEAEPKEKEPKKIQCPHCGEWFEP